MGLDAMEMSINLDTYSGNFKETLHILLVMIMQFLRCSGNFTVIPSQYALTLKCTYLFPP